MNETKKENNGFLSGLKCLASAAEAGDFNFFFNADGLSVEET